MPASSPLAATPLPADIQAKLVVGQVSDPLEHEVDRVADEAMRMPDPDHSVTSTLPQLNQKCAACEEEAAQRPHTKPVGLPKVAGRTAPSIVYEVLRDQGQPLDRLVRASVEPIFHQDFSAVRVHSDSRAAESAKRVGALAYTVGSDIVFGSGRYSPETKAGRSLLAHELTHVVQQRHAPAKATLLQSKVPIGHLGDGFECPAEAAADLFADLGGGFIEASNPAVQRQSDHTDDEADGATTPQPKSPSGSIDITEALFEEDASNPGQLQTAPDPTLGPLLQRQADIPPPPAYPDSFTWFFDFVGAENDFASLFGLTCEDGRERGFYVMWNERTNKSFAGPIAIGDPAKGCKDVAEVHLGEVPPNRKPIYPVGFFHTHPLAPPGCRKLGVGPSQVDKDFAKDTHLPGVVEDTRTATSSCRDAGSFFFGPRVRS